jgi:hypothetical protein
MPETPIEKEFACHARRHMDAEFRVYDAMMAMAISGWNKAQATGQWPDGRAWKETDPLICYAKEYTLANATDLSTAQVANLIGKLEADKWAIPTTDKQRRRAGGVFTTFAYVMIPHEEYVPSNPGKCPPLRYNPATGEKLKAGRLVKGLERLWVRKLTSYLFGSGSLPDAMADAVGDAIAAKKAGTATRDLVTVAVYPEITREQFLAMRQAAGEKPDTATRDLATAATRDLVPDTTSGLVTDRHKRPCDKSEGFKSEQK